jgi:hypothetical protein
MLVSMFRRLLSEPLITDIDIDSTERLVRHRTVLEKKPMLQAVFSEWHRCFLELDEKYFTEARGIRVELGAGVTPIRDTFPEVLATDLVPAPHLDKVLDAGCLDLPEASVRALYGQNCFHHFPNVERFFVEAIRVLVPSGGIILIEPYYGLLAKIVFRRLFTSEFFDMQIPDWIAPVEGPMTGANQALSYIVFERDREVLHAKFPELSVVYTAPLRNYLRYFTSGALNFRQLLPTALVPLLKLIEKALGPLDRYLALHYVIVLRRCPPR